LWCPRGLVADCYQPFLLSLKIELKYDISMNEINNKNKLMLQNAIAIKNILTDILPDDDFFWENNSQDVEDIYTNINFIIKTLREMIIK
jgi:hypothetical protein